eukprot:CAMPEP_0172573712 /NCGR_PEP_ID=MMETSP1067-20121228/136328_1 /TAXON_ID=265564 ORGANISM="Thalassiosira punctigera, Strain Tpunct2005C2" /NCGR_SAMPLE_ID=MMETSP1067 /ASSEMBLY_ACC=CAM_ASM_000444 /LENGTH=555 /DNA_ID=CAMNT_0013366319 /DNA_START=337 /DNA_END=2005 /DNA_ORIENTATION=+
MKIQFDLFLASSVLALHSLSSLAFAQLPPHARGKLKKFETSPDGDADIELFEGGPSIKCRMKNGRGNGNPKTCISGATSVTVVDAECPETLPWSGNPNKKKCFAASVVEGETGKTYAVNSAGDVLERDSSDYPDEEHAPNEDEPPEAYSDRRSLRGGKAEAERSLQGTPVVDVLVVYTQGAKASAAGYGDGPIEDLINLAIVETNGAYANSGVNAELRLAHMHEDTSGYVADVGSTSMRPSLYHLTHKAGNSNDPDGLLDYVHDMRVQYGADMVALITTGAGCGIAWLSGNCETCNPSPAYQFSVTRYDCATGYYSFGHELGHNMGCNHDKGTHDSCGSSDYRYGFRAPDGRYRSVLSYSCATGQCDSNPGGACTRSPFFSNPDPAYTWSNGPMGNPAGVGIGETNNARRISERAGVISNFYAPAPTNEPTKEPTFAPITPSPTRAPAPPTPPPTKAPVPPTDAPTLLPTDFQCSFIASKGPCNDNLLCKWEGNPNNGSCVENGGSGPGPAPPSCAASAAPAETCRAVRGPAPAAGILAPVSVPRFEGAGGVLAI